ncbi:MAG: hypothetical protein WCL16_01610 [bacterium]
MFRWGKTGFVVWVVGPVALMAAIYLPGTLYCRQLNKTCDRRMAILNYLPEMDRQTQRAVATLKRLDPLRGSEVDHGAELSLRIEKMAQQHGLGIRSLKIEDGAVPDKTGGVPYFTVTLQGEGGLQAIVETLNDLQRPEYLCRVATVRMRVMTWIPERVYGGDIVLRCHGASVSGGSR